MKLNIVGNFEIEQKISSMLFILSPYLLLFIEGWWPAVSFWFS